MSYDINSKQSNCLYTSKIDEKLSDINQCRFAFSSDEKVLAYIDTFNIATINMETGKIIAEKLRDSG